MYNGKTTFCAQNSMQIYGVNQRAQGKNVLPQVQYQSCSVLEGDLKGGKINEKGNKKISMFSHKMAYDHCVIRVIFKVPGENLHCTV